MQIQDLVIEGSFSAIWLNLPVFLNAAEAGIGGFSAPGRAERIFKFSTCFWSPESC